MVGAPMTAIMRPALHAARAAAICALDILDTVLGYRGDDARWWREYADAGAGRLADAEAARDVWEPGEIPTRSVHPSVDITDPVDRWEQ